MLWMPQYEESIQVRMMVCAHIQEAGLRGRKATFHRVEACCAWAVEANVPGLITNCLHGVDSRGGNMVQRVRRGRRGIAFRLPQPRSE